MIGSCERLAVLQRAYLNLRLAVRRCQWLIVKRNSSQRALQSLLYCVVEYLLYTETSETSSFFDVSDLTASGCPAECCSNKSEAYQLNQMDVLKDRTKKRQKFHNIMVQ